jgi:hypothetical protein
VRNLLRAQAAFFEAHQAEVDSILLRLRESETRLKDSERRAEENERRAEDYAAGWRVADAAATEVRWRSPRSARRLCSKKYIR